MRGVLLIVLFLLLFPSLTALTGEVITGEASSLPTNVSIFVEPAPPIINILRPTNTTYFDTNVLLNYTIGNFPSHVWYNLGNGNNITLPNSTAYSTFFNTTLGFHTLYLFANNSYGIRVSNVSFTVSTLPPSSSSSSGSGGGSGGGDGGGIPIEEFSLDKKLIEVSLLQGESREANFEITNVLNKNLDITIEFLDLENFVLISEEKFQVSPFAKKIVNLNFFAPSRLLPGLYLGKIIVKTPLTQKTINVILEVKNREALFDINLEVLPQYKLVAPGKKISVLIEMANIGLRGTAVDVDLHLFVMDLDKNIIYDVSKETLAVKTELSLTRKVDIPSDIDYGTYIILGEITYGNITASSYDTLEVTEKNAFSSVWIIFLLILLILIFYARKKYSENKEYFRNILKKIKRNFLKMTGK